MKLQLFSFLPTLLLCIAFEEIPLGSFANSCWHKHSPTTERGGREIKPGLTSNLISSGAESRKSASVCLPAEVYQPRWLNFLLVLFPLLLQTDYVNSSQVVFFFLKGFNLTLAAAPLYGFLTGSPVLCCHWDLWRNSNYFQFLTCTIARFFESSPLTPSKSGLYISIYMSYSRLFLFV